MKKEWLGEMMSKARGTLEEAVSKTIAYTNEAYNNSTKSGLFAQISSPTNHMNADEYLMSSDGIPIFYDVIDHSSGGLQSTRPLRDLHNVLLLNQKEFVGKLTISLSQVLDVFDRLNIVRIQYQDEHRTKLKNLLLFVGMSSNSGFKESLETQRTIYVPCISIDKIQVPFCFDHPAKACVRLRFFFPPDHTSINENSVARTQSNLLSPKGQNVETLLKRSRPEAAPRSQLRTGSSASILTASAANSPPLISDMNIIENPSRSLGTVRNEERRRESVPASEKVWNDQGTLWLNEEWHSRNPIRESPGMVKNETMQGTSEPRRPHRRTDFLLSEEEGSSDAPVGHRTVAKTPDTTLQKTKALEAKMKNWARKDGHLKDLPTLLASLTEVR